VSGVDAAVLIPVKGFGAAKGRLSSVLDRDQRAGLARWLAERVVAAAAGSPTFVACDDDDVAGWADRLGAEVLWSPGLGLNGAVDAGRSTIAGKGVEHVVIAHSDLPLATGLASLAAVDTICLIPDRRRDGTNVLSLPTRAPLTASYGGGSFSRHLEQAMRSGLRVEVRADPRLAIDVDTPDDLRHPSVEPLLPPWLRTILASPR
jgi:2-phospho-L-lactate guanylyltransferase